MKAIKKDQACPIQAYFVSLSGFTESAIEQERDAARRVSLVDGKKAIEILVNSRILVDPVVAAETSGRFAGAGSDLNLQSTAHLVISKLGMLWLFIYTKEKNPVSYSLIHSDNTPISPNLLAGIQLDKGFRKIVSGLSYLIPGLKRSETNSLADVKKRYFSYLANVCGQIQLDGLPATKRSGPKSLS